jgi:myosin-5
MVEKAYSLRLDFCNLQDIQRYKLSDPRSFHYLNQSSCIEVDGINDAEEYLATRRVMDIVGINEEEQVSLLLF